MNKEFLVETGYGTENCKFAISEYVNSFVPGGIYLGLMSHDKDMGCWCMYCDISTNLPTTSFLKAPPENAIYIRDDKAWYPDIRKTFINNKLAVSTGNKLRSGFCTYDEWIVDVDKLKEIAEILE